jgi:membrane protein DedA with SNARE-associated domain
MDHVYAFLTVASGYMLSFAVGAWIGRPLLDRLVQKILGK